MGPLNSSARKLSRLAILIALVCTGCEAPVRGEVPAATLAAGNQTQVGLLGAYCWWWGGWFYGTSECAGGLGTATPSSPLVLRSSQTFQIILPKEEGSADVTLCWIHAQKDDWAERGETWLRWDQPVQDCEKFSDIEVVILTGPEKPGYHALSLSAFWGGQKDAFYGFLVEVIP